MENGLSLFLILRLSMFAYLQDTYETLFFIVDLHAVCIITTTFQKFK